ncbi:hypothetical protein BKA93DRAFT_830279 [Sparassis latifolia]
METPMRMSGGTADHLLARTSEHSPSIATCTSPLDGASLRLLVLQKADRSGTQIIYILPSSLIAVPVGGEVNQQFKKAAEALDAKLQNLVVSVSAV